MDIQYLAECHEAFYLSVWKFSKHIAHARLPKQAAIACFQNQSVPLKTYPMTVVGLVGLHRLKKDILSALTQGCVGIQGSKCQSRSHNHLQTMHICLWHEYGCQSH